MITDLQCWVRHDEAPEEWAGKLCWRFLPGHSHQPIASIWAGPHEPINPDTRLQLAQPPAGFDMENR